MHGAPVCPLDLGRGGPYMLALVRQHPSLHDRARAQCGVCHGFGLGSTARPSLSRPRPNLALSLIPPSPRPRPCPRRPHADYQPPPTSPARGLASRATRTTTTRTPTSRPCPPMAASLSICAHVRTAPAKRVDGGHMRALPAPISRRALLVLTALARVR